MVWIKSNAFDDATKSAMIRSLEATVAFKQAQTRISEERLEHQRGEWVRKAHVTKMWVRNAGEIKYTFLNAAPPAICTELGLGPEAQEVIERVMEGLLNQLASKVDDGTGDDEEQVEAAE